MPNKVASVFLLLLSKSTVPTEVCWQVIFSNSHSHHITFAGNWCLSSTLLAAAALQSIHNLTTATLARRGWIWRKFNKGSRDALKASVSNEQADSATTLQRQKMWWISLILHRFHWQRAHSDVIMCKMLSAASPSASLTHFRLGLCVDEQHNCLCLFRS